MENWRHRDVPLVRLWLAVLCGYLALGATLQVLPSFVADRFGGGATAAGTAVGIAFLATALARPFAGRFADAGYGRPVVMAGGLLGALGGLGHLWAPSFAVLLVSRLLMGAGEAALFSGALPWVLAPVPGERRGRVAGWFGLSMWGGLAAGPLIGSAVGGRADTVWFVVVGLTVLSALLVATTRSRPESGAALPLLPTGWRDVVPRGAGVPGLAFGLSSYGYGTVAALLVLHLRDEHVGADGYGLTLFAAAFLVTRTLGSPAVDRFGGRVVAALSVLAEAVGLALVATGRSWAPMLGGVVVTGAGVALMYPATVAVTLRRAGALRPGTSIGVMTSFWDLGVMVAGPLGGAIAAGVNASVAFAVAAVLALLSLVVTAAVPTGRRVEVERVPEGSSARS